LINIDLNLKNATVVPGSEEVTKIPMVFFDSISLKVQA